MEMETIKKIDEDKQNTPCSHQSQNSEHKSKRLEPPFNTLKVSLSKEELRRKREENELEDEISDISKYIKNKLSYVADIFRIPFPHITDPKRLLLYLLSKESRKPDDNIVLRQFLTLYPEFIETLKLKEELSDPKELLLKIATHLKKEEFLRDTIVFYNGQLAKTFYLILEGEVSVLIPVEYNVNITDRELFSYMDLLLQNKEYELIKLILESNSIKLNEDDYKDNIQYMRCKNAIERVLPANIETEEISTLNYIERYNYFKGKSIVTLKDKINELKLDNEKTSKNKKEQKNDNQKNNSKLSNKLIITENNNEKISEKEPSENDSENDNEEIENVKKDKDFYYNREQTFVVWKYYEICKLTKGKCFGELALQKEGKKRNATIITNSDCVFGTLQKEAYQMFVRETMDRARKINVELLLRSKLFKGYPPEKFELHYFNHFKFLKKKKCDYLFWQNTDRDFIYFIKKGEVEIELFGSCIKIDEILKNLGKTDDSQSLKELVKEHKKLSNFCNTNKKFNVLIFSGGDAVGLNDHLISDIDKKFAFNAFCVTNCEIFAIDEKLFDRMLEEKIIKSNYSTMIKDRKMRLIERLTKLKTNSIYQYYNLIKNNNDLDDENFKELFENELTINSKKKEMKKIIIKDFANSLKNYLYTEEHLNFFNKNNNNNLYTENNFNSCKNNLTVRNSSYGKTRRKSKTKERIEVKSRVNYNIKNQINNNGYKTERNTNTSPNFTKKFDKKPMKKLAIDSIKPININNNINDTVSNKESQTQTLTNRIYSKSQTNMNSLNNKPQNKGNSSRLTIDTNCNMKSNNAKTRNNSKYNLNSLLKDKKTLDIFKSESEKFGNNIQNTPETLFLSKNNVQKFFVKNSLLFNSFIDKLLLIDCDNTIPTKQIFKKKKQNNKTQHIILKTEPDELNNKFRKRNTTINAISTKNNGIKLQNFDQYINFMEKKHNIKNGTMLFHINNLKKDSEKIMSCANRTSTNFFKIKNIINEK